MLKEVKLRGCLCSVDVSGVLHYHPYCLGIFPRSWEFGNKLGI